MNNELALPTPSAIPSYRPFELETTPPRSIGLVHMTVNIPSTFQSKPPSGQKPSPSRWKSLEYRLYAAVACIVIPIMVWIPIALSSCACLAILRQFICSLPHSFTPQLFTLFLEIVPRLVLWSQGRESCLKPLPSSLWGINHTQDDSDAQYHSFRSNFPALAKGTCVYLFVRFVWIHSATAPPQNNLYLIPVNLIFSFLLIVGLHGASALKILLILSINYLIAKLCRGSKFGPALTWIFNGAVLFANDRYNGHSFGDLLPALGYLVIVPRLIGSFHVLMS